MIYPKHTHNTRRALYAEGLAIYDTSKHVSLSKDINKKYLNTLNKYLDQNGLQVNPQKCEVITFTKSLTQEHGTELNLNEAPIK